MIEFISIHLPKTAGLSFRAVLQNVYGEERVCHLNRPTVKDNNGVSSKIIPNGTRALIGHYTFSEVSNLLSETGAPLVTWLRDPVERVLSNYYFFIKRINNEDGNPRRGETLIEYSRLDGSRNRMSDFLDGISLEELSFVGITEHFAEDLKEMSSKLGWPKVAEPPRVNDNNEYRSLAAPPDENVLSEIKRLNQRDILLYEEALRLRELRRLRLERI